MQQPPQPITSGAPLPQAAAPPVVPPPPPINATPQIYCEFYADPAMDPYLGDYTDALAYFKLPVNGVNVPTPQETATCVYHVAMHEPMAFLFLCCDDATAPAGDPGCIQLCHCITMYFPCMAHISQWDGQGFGFHGDHVRQQIQMVMIPADSFHQAPIFNIPTADAIHAKFAANLQLEVVGPIANNDPVSMP